ncbi:MAG: hypothetical protein ACI9J3_000168 [Parvicellaceae bacterium]
MEGNCGGWPNFFLVGGPNSATGCPTSVYMSVTDELNYGACDGTLTINTTGGTPPYTFVAVSSGNTYSYLGSGTDTSHLFFGICPGAYEGFIINSLGDTCILAGGGYGCGCGSGTGCGQLGGGAGSACGATVGAALPPPLIIDDCGHYCGCITMPGANHCATVSGGVPPYQYNFDGIGWTSSSCIITYEGYTGNIQVMDAIGQMVSGPCNFIGPCAAPPAPNSSSVVPITCNGMCDAEIEISYYFFGDELSSGLELYLSSGGGPGFDIPIQIIGVVSNPGVLEYATFYGVCPGQYEVWGAGNGCGHNQGPITNIIVTEPPVLDFSFNSVTNSTNTTSLDGEIDLSGSGGAPGYTYNINGGVYQGSGTFTGLDTGTHTVCVMDINGCTICLDTIIGFMPANNCPTSIFMSATDETTYAGCDGTLTINSTGGNPPYTFVAISSANTYSFIGSATDTSYTFPAVCPGNYEGFVINSSGDTCLLAGGGYGCLCGSGTGDGVLGGGAGGSCGAGVGAAAAILSVTCVADQVPCLSTIAFDNVVAFGDALPLQYSWNLGATWLSSPGNPIDNGCMPFESITVMDNIGQIVTASCIADPLSDCYTEVIPNIAFSSPVSCFGNCDGVIEIGILNGSSSPLIAPGPYSVYDNGIWAGLIPHRDSTITFNGLCSGSHQFFIDDSYGCWQFASVNLTLAEPSLLSLSFNVNNESCSGLCDGSLELLAAGGTPPYSHSADCGVTFQSSNLFTGLCPGTYCTIIEDANGCQVTGSEGILPGGTVSILNDSTFDESFSGSNDGIIYSSGTTGTPPYQYSIDGITWQASGTFSGLAPGSYNICVQDVNGCESCTSVVINAGVICTISTSIVSTTSPLCFGDCNGSATMSFSGNIGPVSACTWSNGDFGPTATNLCAGTYTVTVTDSAGCTIIDSVSILDPPPLSASIFEQQVPWPSQCNGEMEAFASGGTGAYSYIWNDCTFGFTGVIGPDYIGACEGDYYVEVTDANGCTVSTTCYSLLELDCNLAGTISSTEPNCAISCNGTATIIASGGMGSNIYSWSNGDSGLTADSLCGSWVYVSVIDSIGCSISDSIQLTNPSPMFASIDLVQSPDFGTCNGIMQADITGGNAPYIYVWMDCTGAPFDTSDTISNLCAGNYMLEATDANGCIAITNCYSLLELPCVNSNDSITEISCFEYVSTAGSLYTSSGIYYDTLANAAGCDSVITIDLTIVNIDSSITQTGAVLTANQNGVSYQWIDCNSGFVPIPGATNQSYTATANGSYAVIIDDGFCTDTSACANVLSIGLIENNFGVLSVYPNPSDTYFTLEVSKSSSYQIKLMDQLGRIVLTDQFTSNMHRLNIDQISSGQYILLINNDNGLSETRKVHILR